MKIASLVGIEEYVGNVSVHQFKDIYVREHREYHHDNIKLITTDKTTNRKRIMEPNELLDDTGVYALIIVPIICEKHI